MLSISLSPRKRVQLGWQVIIISLMCGWPEEGGFGSCVVSSPGGLLLGVMLCSFLARVVWDFSRLGKSILHHSVRAECCSSKQPQTLGCFGGQTPQLEDFLSSHHRVVWALRDHLVQRPLPLEQMPQCPIQPGFDICDIPTKLHPLVPPMPVLAVDG